MSFLRRSTLKAIILSGVVIIAGITAGHFLLRKRYSVVDLQEWVDKENIRPSYIYLTTDSRVVEHPTLYNNVMHLEVTRPYIYISDLEVALPYSSQDWFLYADIIISKTEADSFTGRGEIFLLQTDLIVNITNAFRETVRSTLTGEEMSVDEYGELRERIKANDPKKFEIFAVFFDRDGIAVYLDFTAQGIAAYAITLEELRDMGRGLPFFPLPARYYFLKMQSFEETMTTSYIVTWNTILQTLMD